MNSMERPMEKAVLAAVQTTESDTHFQYSLEELKNLVENTGVEVVGEVTQKRDSIDNRTLIGKGKIQELKHLVEETEASAVVFNQELSPSQVRNIQNEIDVKILDRIQVILDIFAIRATSREGGLQVQLAQLNYLLPRLVGHGINMSRLGGGIGTRGPGETKLETDRRHINRQISDIRKELKKVEDHRDRIRQQRDRTNLFRIGLIGYTNAGKSTVLNALTNSQTYEKDELFATLDPVTRKLELASGLQVTLTDTVGFIQDLPTQLIESFQSTLEESKDVDLLLHIVDASAPYEFYLAGVERIFAIAIQIALSMLMYTAIRYGKKWLIALAFEIHFIVDFVTVLAGNFLDDIVMELLIGILAAMISYVTYMIWNRCSKEKQA